MASVNSTKVRLGLISLTEQPPLVGHLSLPSPLALKQSPSPPPQRVKFTTSTDMKCLSFFMVGLTAVSAFVPTASLFSSDAHEAAASTARKNEFQNKDTAGASVALQTDPLAFATREAGKVRQLSALSEIGSSRFGKFKFLLFRFLGP